MSRGYWVKPAGATYAPRSLVSVIVRGTPVGPESRHGRTMTAWDSAAVAASVWREGRWTAPAFERFDTPDTLHDWIEGRASTRTGTFVVSPVASHALTLSRFWDRLDTFGARWAPRGSHRPKPDRSRGAPPAGPAVTGGSGHHSRPGPQTVPAAYIFRQMVLRGKADIVKYAVAGKCLTWVSGMQYLPMQEHAIAASVGFSWQRSGGPLPVGSSRLDDLTDRAECWLLAFQRLCDWWREIDGGPWRPTIGGLADSYFRRRIEPKAVLAHNDDYARTLEEAALFGGRASTWYYGTIGRPSVKAADESTGPPLAPYPAEPGPVELWDVSSMYPTILSNADFPVRHMYNWKAPSLPWLRAMMDEWLVIARVTLRSDRPEYPYRGEKMIQYPTGEYQTTLATPELANALANNEVLACHHAATYQRGRPFARAASELTDRRREAEARGDKLWGTFIKLLSNNWGGRMAMRRTGMSERPDVYPEGGMQWGGWGEGEGDARKRFVVLAGLVWELTTARHHGRPLASMFVFLTSYGRALMRDIRAVLPVRSVVSQDTDGLWVLRPTARQRTTAVALARSQGFRLTVRETCTNGRWFGPKHYWNDTGWTLAGIRQERQWMGTLRVRDDYTVNPVLSNPHAPPSHVWECVRESDLTVLDRDGRTGPDGWQSPTQLGPWRPPV